MAEGLYDFNAPKYYFDLANPEEPDDSYFDCVNEDGVFLDDLGTTAAAGQSRRRGPIETPRRPASTSPTTVKRMGETPKGGAKSRRSLIGMTPTIGDRQSPRLAAIAKAMRRSNAAIRSGGSGPAGAPKTSVSSQLNKVHKQKAARPSVPKVPGGRLSPGEQQELAVICNVGGAKRRTGSTGSQKSGPSGPTKPQEFHFATDSRLRNQRPSSVSGEQAAAAPKPARTGPTRPKEFHFATDGRVKTHDQAAVPDPVDFSRMLRSNAAASCKERPKGPTRPQPFNLTETKKTKTEEGNAFVSMAELNLKYYTKTPQRFRSSKRIAGSTEELNQDGKKNKGYTNTATIPHTPNLSTRGRTRQNNCLTHEEREQMEFEEAQKRAFKAQPVNKKVFQEPDTGYQVMKKPPTVPEPFNITDIKKADLLLGHNFKEMCNKLGGSTSSLASLPHGGIPQKWDKTTTKVEAFSFDQRNKMSQQKKNELIQKVIEDEKKMAEFHANPMPRFEGGLKGLPEKIPLAPTQQKPFTLESDLRGEQKQEQFKSKLKEQEQLEQEQRLFHARPDTVVHNKPFIPEKSHKPLTDISGFTLNTEKRSSERNEYELHRKKMEDELLAAKREFEERKAAEELAEVARLRKENVHKAQPMPQYKPMQLKPSEQKNTVPVSPNFATNARLRTRHGSNSTMNSSSATFTAE